MQSAFVITTSGRASVSRALAASSPAFTVAARSFHFSVARREGESLASIADVVEAGPYALTAADKEAGKQRSEGVSGGRVENKLTSPVRRESQHKQAPTWSLDT